MNSLSLTLSDLQASAAAYWITLVQEQQDDLATHDEAAEVIDTMFDLDPCVAPPSTETEEENTTPLEQIIEQAKEVLASALLGQQSTLCADASGCFTALVRVYRSHQDRPYTILVQGGAVEQTTVDHVEHEEQVIAVKETTSVSLNLPGDQQVTVSWQGPCYSRSAGRMDTNPELVVSGGRISWVGAVTGALLVTYAMPYDLLTIRTTENDCAVTALYHLSIDELDIQPPSTDDQAEQLCGYIKGQFGEAEDDDNGKCYKEITHQILCNCSGKSAGGGYTERLGSACPDGVAPGSVVERVDKITYVTCQDEEDIVHDPEYYEEVCCHPPNIPLPRCKNKYSTFTGSGLTPEQRKALEGMYDGRVILVAVGPKTEPCGKLTVSQKVIPASCCDEVEPLAHAPENPSTVTLGQRVELCVLGGKSSLTWTSSVGYTFWNGTQKMVGGSCAIIYVSSQACEDGWIRVTDGCTTLIMRLHRVDFEPLSVELAENLAIGIANINVTGSIFPVTLTTTGAHTHFANGEKTIVVLSAGLVSVTIEREQGCIGTFTVAGVNECGETSSTPVDPKDEGGLVCFDYRTGGSTSLSGWCADGPLVNDPPDWWEGGKFLYQFTAASSVTCTLPEETFYVDNPARITIVKANPEDLPTTYWIQYYMYIGGDKVDAPCTECTHE
ncbi:MAG: hypothetical protein KKA76_18015 [Proteobacteria bacterium]|nr:hypothetical protein [Pseudomonadota bacterium]